MKESNYEKNKIEKEKKKENNFPSKDFAEILYSNKKKNIPEKINP